MNDTPKTFIEWCIKTAFFRRKQTFLDQFFTLSIQLCRNGSGQRIQLLCGHQIFTDQPALSRISLAFSG